MASASSVDASAELSKRRATPEDDLDGLVSMGKTRHAVPAAQKTPCKHTVTEVVKTINKRNNGGV